MDTYNEIMKTYLETMSKAPKECQECTRRHFIGCSGCEYSKYWENVKREHRKDVNRDESK